MENAFSHYRIIRSLGTGGMGEVYLARDTSLGRDVAVKILPAALANDPELIRRFEQEAKAASALNHPNILTIHEIGQCGDLHFIVNEYIKGENLHERFDRDPLSMEEAVGIALQVADALVAAHRAGIVHRDIKPRNIMVREDGLVKVVDFGIAKLNPSNVGCDDTTLIMTKGVVGTVAYMSPEQLQGMAIDGRSDVWSLGVCLYEMLTGHPPFFQKTVLATAASVLRDEPLPLNESLPPELRRIVAKAMQKKCGERYQTIRDFWLDLKKLRHDLELEGENERPKHSNPQTPPSPARKKLRHYGASLAVGLAVLLLLAIVSVPKYFHYKAVKDDQYGREFWKLRTGDNLNKARVSFENAVWYDPKYAQGYSDLADTYVLMEEYLGFPTQETIPKAESYARQALAIDNSLAETHTSLAFILTKLYRWEEAEKEFKRAIELNPTYPKAHQWYSLYLRIVGRYDESLTQIKIAHDLDPTSFLIHVNMVISYLAKGENDKAIAEGEELLRLSPNFWGGRAWLGMAYLGKGSQGKSEALSESDKSEALSDLEAAVNHSQDSHTLKANLGFGYALLGVTDKATEQLKQLQELYTQHRGTGQDLAKVYAGMGRNDEAFAWLEADFSVRSGDLPHISWHPAFKSLRGDPRFDDLLRRMGFTQEMMSRIRR